MSPHELSQIEGLDEACQVLGWQRYETEIEHERDWDCHWTERGWKRGNVHIISDNRLTEGMARELILIANLLKALGARL